MCTALLSTICSLPFNVILWYSGILVEKIFVTCVYTYELHTYTAGIKMMRLTTFVVFINLLISSK